MWNNGPKSASGGGISKFYKQPPWQANVGVPNGSHPTPLRGVPDVAATADPRSGYRVLVDGQPMVIGGTSAVAPLWAALACRLSEALGRPLGLLQPLLYDGATAQPQPLRVPRHHAGRHRRLQGGPRLGRLYRARRARRHRTA
ncbi:hypothetical protein ACFQ1I_46725 [Kitasatospora arboriphila]